MKREFEHMPDRIARLERDHRGYPIPYFVMREPGKPVDFRIVDPRKFVTAVEHGACWVCGQGLGAFKAFVGGPLSAAQRAYADPPVHRDCAEFSARYCPFLAIPTASRREANKPAHVSMPGVHIQANHECTAILIVKSYAVERAGNSFLLRAGKPVEVLWWSSGREATREEVEEAIAQARTRPELDRLPNNGKVAILTGLDSLPLPI